MTASLIMIVTMAVLYACGVYLLLERSMTRVLFGFLLIGNATNLLLITVAGASGNAPIVGEDGTLEDYTDPLPQALILTAIVITFGVSAFLMALIYRSWLLSRADTVADDRDDVELRTAEPGDADEAPSGPQEDSDFARTEEAP